ncbi:hypothetical protein AC579_6006 [Pseudocercospora musae]|uniref:Uncharacterized protein n=1 Tax=Pseudocercospora musae TaxID=113226 RepID=A0A139H7F1_9PEZI|nr:hypothetical protein AC579_6006 [Pseudocercospora musae]KXS98289.1 hypothetical protein AC579_6006 [Pseudocercospora musae]
MTWGSISVLVGLCTIHIAAQAQVVTVIVHKSCDVTVGHRSTQPYRTSIYPSQFDAQQEFTASQPWSGSSDSASSQSPGATSKLSNYATDSS